MTRINACNVFLSSIFLALAGCTDITEYDVLVEASIIVYDSDLQIVRQADGSGRPEAFSRFQDMF